MAAKKIKQQTEGDELESFKLYTFADTEKITTYDRSSLERFRDSGILKTRKLNGGKVVTTKKWIIEMLNALSENGPLEF